MSLAASVPTSTATQHGGMLLDLPRELRDMIYRYVVKGTHLVDARPDHLGSVGDITESHRTILRCHGMELPNSDLSILRVSKIINEEATAVLYSESTFRIYIHFNTDQTVRLSSLSALKRMMTIQLVVTVHYRITKESHAFSPGSGLEWLNSSEQIWKSTLGCISRTNKFRNNLHIRLRRFFSANRLSGLSDMSDTIPGWIIGWLKSMTQFRTVVLQNIIQNLVSPTQKERNFLTNKQNREANVMERYLGRMLGPAVRSHQQCAVTLTFHPQQHLPAILKTRAADLRARAKELELEAKKAEEGA